MIRHRLKGATRLLIHDTGGIEAAAHLLGLSTAHVGRWQNMATEDSISILCAALLEAQDSVHPHVTQALAAIGGHILVARPRIEGEGRWAAHLAATVKESGDVLSRFGEALANDGEVSAREAEGLLVEVDQALSALSGLRAELEKQVTQGAATGG